MIYNMANGAFRQEETFPHGLTPPTRWAAARLTPELPIRPKWAKPVSIASPTTVRFQVNEPVKNDAASNTQ